MIGTRIALILITGLLATACAGDDAGQTAAQGADTSATTAASAEEADPEPENPLLANGEPAAGTPAPDLTFPMSDGTEASLSDFEGRPLVLNFFAAWCAPCVREMPDFEAVHQQVRDEIQFVGIAIQDLPGDSEDIVAETGVTYPWGINERGDFLVEFGTPTMPSTVFISAEGRVLEVARGALTEDRLIEKIQGHFSVAV